MRVKTEPKDKEKDSTPRRTSIDIRPFRDDLKEAVEVIKRGGVILYPTDTIWGIGCDATNEEAVKRVYEIKRRADSKALISLVDTEAKIEFYIRNVPAIAWDVIELNTKPTTVIFSGARNLAPNLLAADGSVALRMTEEPFSKSLCFRLGKAVVSTSANISGEPAPQNFSEVSDEIINAVDYVVKYRQKDMSKAKPSTIIMLGENGEVKIIRN